jgi:hypothetical protein
LMPNRYRPRFAAFVLLAQSGDSLERPRGGMPDARAPAN